MARKTANRPDARQAGEDGIEHLIVDIRGDSMDDIEPSRENVKLLDKLNPLWLPNGSIRAVLAMSIVGAFVYMCINTGNTEALAAIAVMVAKDYFQSRDKVE